MGGGSLAAGSLRLSNIMSSLTRARRFGTRHTGIMTDSTTSAPCSRRLFLVGTATTFAGAVLAACGSSKTEASAKDVPVGGATIVGKYIISQPKAGEYKAWSTKCPHAGTAIDTINGSTAKCPAHNSTFNVNTGQRISGPATSGLTEAKASLNNDKIEVS